MGSIKRAQLAQMDIEKMHSQHPARRRILELEGEVERLGRCNEALSKSHAEQRNLLEGEIKRLRERVEELEF